jgi:hypothetical protein
MVFVRSRSDQLDAAQESPCDKRDLRDYKHAGAPNALALLHSRTIFCADSKLSLLSPLTLINYLIHSTLKR